MSNRLFWWLWSECSPLPIPNREVKPHIADDTALVRGKVGRRQSFIKEFQSGLLFYFWWLWSSVVGQADGIPHLFPFRAEGVGSADC